MGLGETLHALQKQVDTLHYAQGLGKQIYCNPGVGSDNYLGTSPELGTDTLAAALAQATAGKNDVVYLIGDGGTAGTARQSAKLSWNKAATHLVGVTAPAYNQRARIAPTAAIAAFSPLVEVTASGCIFKNLSAFHGFDAGMAAQICWRDTGSRNYYEDVWFGGMGSTDHADADDTGSRSLLLEGAESKFVRCTVGLDTVTRSVANASLEFKTTNCKRHTFTDCFFPFMGSSANVLGILVAAAAASDRWQLFRNCIFLNNIKSTSTAMTGLAKLAAAIGGLLLFKDCTMLGIGEWGFDATSEAQIYIDGGTVTAASAGIAVNPS